ncbi:hypothetical protein GWK47_045892 [Chionoecetes opilio]|uniref:Uncharacterized protein n=1 Tax=Chionoecetes opilio TaxID=41210 RepID=A0A8J4YCI4_CHIOP|nr:hypothetical protein GWK47_045892 [Chionoecetes opilio]
MADYCWTLKRDIPAADHSRSFEEFRTHSQRAPSLSTSPTRWGKSLRVGVQRSRGTSCWSRQCFLPFPCRLGGCVGYRKWWPTSRLFDPEKIFPKLVVDLYGKDKIGTFTAEWQTSGSALLTIPVHHLL